MAAKLVFAAISAAASVYGAVGQIQAAKAAAKIKTAQLELQMEGARLKAASDKRNLAINFERTYSTQIALAGASGAQMGGSWNAITRTDYNNFQQDYRLIGLYSSAQVSQFGLGIASAKQEEKAVRRSAYGQIVEAGASFGSAAYSYYNPAPPTTKGIRPPASYQGVTAGSGYTQSSGGYAGAGATGRVPR